MPEHMNPGYIISSAREQDIELLAAIELAAARLLIGHAPESVLKETTSQDVLGKAQRDGHLWVALADDAPVGFAHVVVLEPNAAHLQELDVCPEHGRRGLGTRLVMHVCEWAAAAGYEAGSLTTFRDVPWNMPFYARFGFRVVLIPRSLPRCDALLRMNAAAGSTRHVEWSCEDRARNDSQYGTYAIGRDDLHEDDAVAGADGLV